MYLRHQWKNPPEKFGALQVGKVLSNGNFAIFRTNLRQRIRHTRVYAARNFADVSGENGVEISDTFYAFGPQLNTFMSDRIFLE